MKRNVSCTGRLHSTHLFTIKDYPKSGAERNFLSLQSSPVHLKKRAEQDNYFHSMVFECPRNGYMDFCDFSPTCFFTFDRTGIIIGCNLMGAALLQTERSELIGKSILHYISEEDQNKFRLHQAKIFNQPSVPGINKEICQLKLINKDGTCSHARFESLAEWDATASILQMRSAVFDVSEKKDLETSLKKTLDQLETNFRERTIELLVRNVQLREEIKERKRMEAALRNSEQELTFRNRIAEVFLENESKGEKVYVDVLKIIQEAMASTHGIFSYLDRKEDIFVVPAACWAGKSFPDLKFPGHPWRDSAWERALLNKESFYSNDPFKLAKGDMRVKRAMLTPIVHSEKLIGFLGVGDKAVDYTEADRNRLENFAAYIAPILFSKLQRDFLDEERRETEKELEESREQLRALAARLEDIREEERKVIAREIHDEFGQALTCLKMDLSFFSRKLHEDQKDLLEKTNSMMRLIDNNIQLIRDVSSQLRPGILDDFGLLSAIEWQLQSFYIRTGIKYRIGSNLDGKDFDPKIRTTLFRVFQEALTNVMRHSEATEVSIELNIETEFFLTMRVKDNGKGISEEAISDKKSLGLLGMRERILLLGGKFQIKGLPGKGTEIEVIISV